MRTLIACLIAAATFRPVLAAAAPDRYLYVLSCDARLLKADTRLERITTVVNLADRTAARRLIPQVRGVLDGCLTEQAVYDPHAARFYTVVPRQAESKDDGTKDYVVLAFSVPGNEPVGEIPAGDSLAAVPHVDIDLTGHVAVTDPTAWSPATDWDLSGYAGVATRPRNQLLETSAARALLRIFAPGTDSLTLAVADRAAKTLVYLDALPRTTARNVHLAPGGRAVLVEEVDSDATQDSAKTGRLMLFNAATGRLRATILSQRIKTMIFLAISPNGKAIYHRDEDLAFVNLGQVYAADPVLRPSAEGFPGMFFADR